MIPDSETAADMGSSQILFPNNTCIIFIFCKGNKKSPIVARGFNIFLKEVR